MLFSFHNLAVNMLKLSNINDEGNHLKSIQLLIYYVLCELCRKKVENLFVQLSLGNINISLIV
jgi:hypothetical protein